MTQKKKKDIKFENNPNPLSVFDKEKVSMGQKILVGSLGFGTGALGHRFAGSLRPSLESELKKKLPVPHGYQLGTVTYFLSLILPESEIKYFIQGAAAGMTVDDILYHTFQNYKFPKIDIGDTEQWNYITKFSSMLHVDETLPLPEKESIILPYFPQTVYEQRGNPLQEKAIERVRKECKIEDGHIGLSDCFWLQQWFLYFGMYEGDEGLWPGHDRIRTLAKLLRVRDSNNWDKDGHFCFRFDCDDGANGVNQVLDSMGFNIRFGLISQNPTIVDGLNPLHHIFPLVKSGGRLWAVETIKNSPIVPMEYVHEIFKNLQRVVIVEGDGNYYEYNDWRAVKLRQEMGEA